MSDVGQYNIINIDDNEISKKITIRKIQNLVHFTRFKNLESILRNGFISRKILLEKNFYFEPNDIGRWDCKDDATCFSIEFPNSFLLNTFKKKYPHSKWVIILLDIKLINHCSKINFCNKNAAGASNWINSPISQTVYAFESMFAECIIHSKSPLRSEQLYIKDYLPTNVQAEILIEDIIDPQYIKCMLFENIEDLEACKNMFIDKNIFYKYNPKVDVRYFREREDFPWEDR